MIIILQHLFINTTFITENYISICSYFFHSIYYSMGIYVTKVITKGK